MMVLSIVISISVLLVGAGFFFAIFQFFRKQIQEEMRAHQEQMMQLSQQQFALEQERAASELKTSKQAVELTVQGLKEELTKYQQLMREFEQERSQKYGSLENELKNASQATINLQETTTRLNNILGNVKLRGQWGERMAEDIIQYAGLTEGVNYLKQTKLQLSGNKPDYTFLLPNGHKINMDVKFPLDNYLQMVNADGDDDRARFLKDFIRNVKDRIKEIQSRDYINTAEDTLDFVMLFIPNEQVFGLVHEKMPGLMDEALAQKVVLCSPFTLYAMLSVVRQAYENFRYEKDLTDIIKLIDQFAKIYERFKLRFDDIGKAIEKLDATYDDVRSKSFKQLDTKIQHIDDYKKGKGVAIDADALLIDTDHESSKDKSVV